MIEGQPLRAAFFFESSVKVKNLRMKEIFVKINNMGKYGLNA
ncbi:hypothetical protein SAMN02745190_00089 [Schwartzia succinivorans DSM 10502]|jgi:hypothetical protein|uniref:Uncharacterized protein n=1 Tax=Schwartzia succinivorans DSM 10502 TaxID=1123243 RepID=A0A1M4SD09_9FIRM|nr:hypothetical protein SAMN02745190_00089 [Schwartzia succinivorans DSM 10502]